jgi:hypothetical protein
MIKHSEELWNSAWEEAKQILAGESVQIAFFTFIYNMKYHTAKSVRFQTIPFHPIADRKRMRLLWFEQKIVANELKR